MGRATEAASEERADDAREHDEDDDEERADATAINPTQHIFFIGNTSSSSSFVSEQEQACFTNIALNFGSSTIVSYGPAGFGPAGFGPAGFGPAGSERTGETQEEKEEKEVKKDATEKKTEDANEDKSTLNSRQHTSSTDSRQHASSTDSRQHASSTDAPNLAKKSPFVSDPLARVTREELGKAHATLSRRFFLIEKAKNADIIGIVVGTLGVHRYAEAIRTLKQLIAGMYTFTYAPQAGRMPRQIGNIGG
jgi:hypothetical protein